MKFRNPVSLFPFLLHSLSSWMPFTKRFDAECIPEWRKAYIDYKSLRALVYTIEKVSDIYVTCICYSLYQQHWSLFPQQHTSSILRNNIAARPDSATSYINSPPTQLSDVVARDIETERTQLSNASNREEQLSQDDLGFLYNLLTHGTEQEKMFFDMLDQQLDKVSKFFNGTLSTATLSTYLVLHTWITRTRTWCTIQIHSVANPDEASFRLWPIVEGGWGIYNEIGRAIRLCISVERAEPKTNKP